MGGLKMVVKGGADVVDGTLSRADGGSKLDRGVRELVAASFPQVDLVVGHQASTGFADLRGELSSDASALIADRPEIVVLSIAEEVSRLGSRGVAQESAVDSVRADLVAIVKLIKERIGAHVLVANVSTIDPTDTPMTYSGRVDEPFTLRAHRLDLILVEVSHEEGISIIDVDRLVAELGADGNVEAAARYGPKACERIAAEVVRVLDDYGFFDDRPLLAQVGSRSATS